MTVVQAWSRLSDYLSSEKGEYAPETVAECASCFVFSVRPADKPSGVSTGINPYVIYKGTGKVIADTKFEIVSRVKPIRMIDPKSVG